MKVLLQTQLTHCRRTPCPTQTAPTPSQTLSGRQRAYKLHPNMIAIHWAGRLTYCPTPRPPHTAPHTTMMSDPFDTLSSQHLGSIQTTTRFKAKANVPTVVARHAPPSQAPHTESDSAHEALPQSKLKFNNNAHPGRLTSCRRRPFPAPHSPHTESDPSGSSLGQHPKCTAIQNLTCKVTYPLSAHAMSNP